jgi:hypothetical protein
VAQQAAIMILREIAASDDRSDRLAWFWLAAPAHMSTERASVREVGFESVADDRIPRGASDEG